MCLPNYTVIGDNSNNGGKAKSNIIKGSTATTKARSVASKELSVNGKGRLVASSGSFAILKVRLVASKAHSVASKGEAEAPKGVSLSLNNKNNYRWATN